MIFLWGLVHIFAGLFVDRQFTAVHVCFGFFLIAASMFTK